MKQALILILMAMVVFSFGLAYGGQHKGADSPAGAGPSGKVVDTMDSAGYTYVQLEQAGKKTWVAVPQMKVKKGQTMTFQPGMVMENFESKTLKRKFDRIIFSGGVAN